MAHAHESNTARIWKIFALLSVVTIVEVILGIIKPDSLYLNGILGTSWLNIIFIVLTLYKAYYIAWSFMHLEGEKTWLRRSIVWTLVFFVIYLMTLLMIEGGYIHDTVSPFVKW